MEIIESRENETIIIEPIGRLDNNSARTFERKIDTVVTGETPVVVIDCSRLDYVSSSGLRIFLVAAKRISSAKGRLALCAMQPHVKEVFDVSGFSSILNIRATRKEALIQTARGGEMALGNRPGSSRPGGSRPSGSRVAGSRPAGSRASENRPGSARQGSAQPTRVQTASGDEDQSAAEVGHSAVPASQTSAAEESQPAAPAAPVVSAVAKRPTRAAPPRPPSSRGSAKPGGRRFAPPPPPSSKAPEAAQAAPAAADSPQQSPTTPAQPQPPARMLRSNRPGGLSR